MSDEMIVYVVDDEAAVRNAIKIAMDTAGLKSQLYESAEDFMAVYEGDESGCLLLDIRLGGMTGMQLLEIIHQRNGWLPVIVFTGHGDVNSAVECMKMGAMDFIVKPLDHKVLLGKIHEAIEKSKLLRSQRKSMTDAQRRLQSLTPREREMLQMLVSGKSSKQIARDAGVALKTVCNHRSHLLAKTGAENTADLVRLAMLADMSAKM